MSVQPGLFNTRNRAVHTRKRKIVSHAFSPKSVREFEPYIAGTVRELLSKWDALSDKAKTDASGGALKGYAVVRLYLLSCCANSAEIDGRLGLYSFLQIQLLDWLNALAFE